MQITKENVAEFCNCSKCERVENCIYKNKYQRLPSEFYNSALGLCPKLKGNKKALTE